MGRAPTCEVTSHTFRDTGGAAGRLPSPPLRPPPPPRQRFPGQSFREEAQLAGLTDGPPPSFEAVEMFASANSKLLEGANMLEVVVCMLDKAYTSEGELRPAPQSMGDELLKFKEQACRWGATNPRRPSPLLRPHFPPTHPRTHPKHKPKRKPTRAAMSRLGRAHTRTRTNCCMR